MQIHVHDIESYFVGLASSNAMVIGGRNLKVWGNISPMLGHLHDNFDNFIQNPGVG